MSQSTAVEQENVSRQNEMRQQYWLKKLQNLTPLQLPQSKLTPANRSYRVNEIPFILSTKLYIKVETYCKTGEFNHSDLLLSGFKALLYRYTNNVDIAIVISESTLNESCIQKTTNQFEETLIARTFIDNNDSFTERAHKVKKTCREAYDTHNINPTNFATKMKLDSVSS